jgi:hypothetical protein
MAIFVWQKTKGQFTREELQSLAKVNVESLQEYAYFTYLKVNGKRQKDALLDLSRPKCFMTASMIRRPVCALAAASSNVSSGSSSGSSLR